MSVEKTKSPLSAIKIPKIDIPDVSRRLSLSSLGSPLSDKSFFDESMTPAKLRDLLDKKNYTSAAGIAERIRGMKWLLAQMSMGIDVSMFFTSVVKNVIVKSVELKKLVYMYLTHYADVSTEIRELALLSINSFQKDLASPNQLIRALALRVLTGIRIREIVGIQITALTKCAGDSSPYVRKTAAHALTKLYNLDHEAKDDLIKILEKLLNDRSTIVLGSVLAAFAEICPERTDLLHKHFRKLCSRLSDIDSWGQIIILRVLTRYSRTQFLNPRIDLNTGEEVEGNPEGALSSTQSLNDSLVASNIQASKSSVISALEAALESGGKGFYSDDEEENKTKDKKAEGSDSTDAVDVKNESELAGKAEAAEGGDNDPKKKLKKKKKKKKSKRDDEKSVEEESEEEEDNTPTIQLRGVQDKDHRRLLAATLPLLKSPNAGVVLQVAAMHWYLGSRKTATLSKIVKALCRHALGPKEVQIIVLEHIVAFAKDRPELFKPYLNDFFVQCSSDPIPARACKLKMLSLLADETNVDIILREMTEYVRHSDVEFGKAVIGTVGRLASKFEDKYPIILSGLTAIVVQPNIDDRLVGEAIVVIRMLVQKFKASDMEAEQKKKEEEEKIAEEKRKKREEEGGPAEDDNKEPTLDDISSDDDSDDSAKDDDSDADDDSPKSQKKKKKKAKKKLKKKKKKLKKRIKRMNRDKARTQHEKEMKDPVIMLARMLDRVNVSSARASIIWIIGEFQYKPALYRMGPDALRRLAISFKEETPEVKLQIANMAMKLLLQREDHEILNLLVGYVLELGFYDLDHDVRDRYRFLRGIFQHEELRNFAKRVYLDERPEPELPPISTYQEKLEWGSLSAVVNHIAFGYTHIPDFPSVQPDTSVREVPKVSPPAKKSVSSSSYSGKKKQTSVAGVMSGAAKKRVVDSDDSISSVSSSSSSDSDSSDSSGSSGSSGSSDSDSSDSSSSDGSDAEGNEADSAKQAKAEKAPKKEGPGSDDSVSSSSSSSESSSSDSDDSSDDEQTKPKKSRKVKADKSPVPSAPAASMDLLSFSPSLSPQTGQLSMMANDLKSYVVMDAVQGRGLQAEIRFLREPSDCGPTCIVAQLSLLNTRDESLFDVEINPSEVGDDKQLVSVFDRIETLNSGEMNCMHVRININLKVDRNALKFAINAKDFGALACAMDIPVGEILRPKSMDIDEFQASAASLGGMNEASLVPSGVETASMDTILSKVKKIANAGQCLGSLDTAKSDGDKCVYLAGEEIVSGTLVLIRILASAEGGKPTFKIVVNSSDVLLMGQLVEAFGKF